jgi:hypothetical protein
MRKTILGVLSASLVAAGMTQTAVAAEHHHAQKAERASVSLGRQFPNPNKPAVSPSLAEEDYEYWQGRGRTALAGH